MSIPEELQQFVAAEVASGHYAAIDDVVAAGLRLLRERKLAALRADLDEGLHQIERGECTTLPDEAAIDQFFDDLMQPLNEPAEPVA